MNRFEKSRLTWAAADRIYRLIFPTLLPGSEIIVVEDDSPILALDRQLGIDVIMYHANGMSTTLQEKALFTAFRTITVEHEQRMGELGDWNKLRAMLYFVGYAEEQTWMFKSWILVNWTSVQIATLNGDIHWDKNSNQHDGAQASFKHIPFCSIPHDCIVNSNEAMATKPKAFSAYRGGADA